MLNAVGLQNVGVRAFVAEKLPVLRKFDTAVVANVFGYTTEDYVEVIRVLEDADGLAGYELNISCPNVKKGGMQFGNDPAMRSEVVGAARKAAVKRPLWVKRSEEHTSELQSPDHLVCRLLLDKKKTMATTTPYTTHVHI